MKAKKLDVSFRCGEGGIRCYRVTDYFSLPKIRGGYAIGFSAGTVRLRRSKRTNSTFTERAEVAEAE
jgi:hypothetical protein